MIKLRSTVATLAALVLTASLGASAMAADETEPELVGVYSIESITWLLTRQAVDGEPADVPDRIVASLFMEEGRAGGSGGCNSFFADYQLDGFEVSFGPVGSTLMACLPQVMEIERAYLANLSQVAAYRSGGIEMALLDADGNVILEYEAAPPAGVVGSWVATGINDQKAEASVVTSAVTAQVSAEFSPDGDLTGFDGCNDYFTTYEVEGDSISLSEMIGSTRMACPSEEHAETSLWYYAALASAATWSVDAAGNLELRDADGSLQVGYTPAE